MAALRCSICAINYPEHLDLESCPVCDSELDYFDNVKPSKDWQRAMKMASGQVAIMQLDEPYPPWLFVHHDDLLDLGYQYLEDFDIVVLNGAKYELQGYLQESNCWWIEEVVEADEVNKLREQLEGWHGKTSETS